MIRYKIVVICLGGTINDGWLENLR